MGCGLFALDQRVKFVDAQIADTFDGRGRPVESAGDLADDRPARSNTAIRSRSISEGSAAAGMVGSSSRRDAAAFVTGSWRPIPRDPARLDGAHRQP